jgi:hypothetical protein
VHLQGTVYLYMPGKSCFSTCSSIIFIPKMAVVLPPVWNTLIDNVQSSNSQTLYEALEKSHTEHGLLLRKVLHNHPPHVSQFLTVCFPLEIRLTDCPSRSDHITSSTEQQRSWKLLTTMSQRISNHGTLLSHLRSQTSRTFCHILATHRTCKPTY